MKIQGTDFNLSMSRQNDRDVLHLKINELCVDFDGWKFYPELQYLSLISENGPVANIKGQGALRVLEALDNF